MILKEVVPSGTVGKQTFATTVKAILYGLHASPSGANMTVKIRDGNASGDVVYFGKFLSAYGAKDVPFSNGIRFDKGMHVKVIGALGAAYLEIE